MSTQRTALAIIALALLCAEIAHPTHFAAKKLGRTPDAVSLDSNVLDSLPPIDKQALGSIDVLQYDVGAAPVRITPRVSIPRAAVVTMIGWCGDPDLKATGAGAFLSIDGRVRIDVSRFVGSPRPDVVQYYDSPPLLDSGFRIAIPAATIGTGTHEIQFGVIAKDRRGYFVLGGPLDVTVSNEARTGANGAP